MRLARFLIKSSHKAQSVITVKGTDQIFMEQGTHGSRLSIPQDEVQKIVRERMKDYGKHERYIGRRLLLEEKGCHSY